MPRTSVTEQQQLEDPLVRMICGCLQKVRSLCSAASEDDYTVEETSWNGLNFTCFNSTLKLSGQVWARSPEQRQLLTKWQENFSASSHLFAVDGRLFRTNAACPSPGNKSLRVEASFQTWEVALIILGSISVALMLIGVSFYCIKRRPQHYTTIEMNDRCEILTDS